MSGNGWRPQIESALCIDIWRMDRTGSLRNGAAGTLHWSVGGEQCASVGYTVSLGASSGALTLRYTCENRDFETETVACVIRLTSIPLNYGGRRWYGHCPYTGKRARKLHKFHGINQFCHRTSIRPLPTYASQRVSGCDRVISQRWALRRKIGDALSDLFGEPMKPKWMRWRTFERYAARDAELAERENNHLLRFIGRTLLQTAS